MQQREQYREPDGAADAERALLGVPFAVGYRPSVTSTLGLLEDGGRFGGGLSVMLRDVERMMAHPAVTSPYSYYKAGIANCTFKVRAANREQAKFAHDTLMRFWERSLRQAQLAYDYGWCGYEVMYRYSRGYLQYEGVQDLHPLDAWAVTDRGEWRGLAAQGSTDFYGRDPGRKLFLWGPRHWPAKGLWITHANRWNRWYGRSQLYGAWRPWRRLATRDSAEEMLDGGFYRFAYMGPIVRYPVKAFRQPGGSMDYDAAREKAREIAENAKTGMSVALPGSRDEKGNYEWEIEWGGKTGFDGSALLSYVERLYKEIALGVGVPPELIEAADTGSGWSGRKVPLIGFYTQQVENARSLARQFQWQVIDPLLRWNFGKKAWCEVEVEVEVPRAVSGEPPPGQQPGQPGAGADPLAALMGGGGAGKQPQPPGGEEGQGAPRGGGLADLLAGAEMGFELSLADYRPCRLKRGKNRGKLVWKSARSGRVRWTLPGRGRPKAPGPAQVGGTPAQAQEPERAPDRGEVLARIKAMLRDPSQIDGAGIREALDDLLSLDPADVRAMRAQVDLGGGGAGAGGGKKGRSTATAAGAGAS